MATIVFSVFFTSFIWGYWSLPSLYSNPCKCSNEWFWVEEWIRKVSWYAIILYYGFI